jgi:hypothetical protein
MQLAPAILAGLLPVSGGVPVDAMMPGILDVRLQAISQQANEKGWPFAAEAGTLACVRSLGIKVVIFLPDPKLAEDEDAAMDEFVDDKYVHVTANPLELFAQYGKAHLFAPGLTIEDKIRQLGPFVTLGKKLCDQPKGTVLGPSEL